MSIPPALSSRALLAVLAGIIVWDMTTLQITSTYGVGPKAMPIVVAAGLALSPSAISISLCAATSPNGKSRSQTPILLILGGLAAVIVLIWIDGGFIPAMTILFATTATAFGRRAYLVDLAIGLALATGAYLMFAKLLSLSLPMGPLERLL